MSLYNALFGVNPMAGLVLKALGVTEGDIPRFRDAYYDGENLVLHTRTGGGNRYFYENKNRHKAEFEDSDYGGPFNEDLRNFPGFLYDRDQDFDCTYADFFYSVPEAFQDIFKTLGQLNAEGVKPADKWQALMDNLQNRKNTPETRRALEVGQEIFTQINKVMDGK